MILVSRFSIPDHFIRKSTASPVGLYRMPHCLSPYQIIGVGHTIARVAVTAVDLTATAVGRLLVGHGIAYGIVFVGQSPSLQRIILSAHERCQGCARYSWDGDRRTARSENESAVPGPARDRDRAFNDYSLTRGYNSFGSLYDRSCRARNKSS